MSVYRTIGPLVLISIVIIERKDSLFIGKLYLYIFQQASLIVLTDATLHKFYLSNGKWHKFLLANGDDEILTISAK